MQPTTFQPNAFHGRELISQLLQTKEGKEEFLKQIDKIKAAFSVFNDAIFERNVEVYDFTTHTFKPGEYARLNIKEGDICCRDHLINQVHLLSMNLFPNYADQADVNAYFLHKIFKGTIFFNPEDFIRPGDVSDLIAPSGTQKQTEFLDFLDKIAFKKFKKKENFSENQLVAKQKELNRAVYNFRKTVYNDSTIQDLIDRMYHDKVGDLSSNETTIRSCIFTMLDHFIALIKKERNTHKWLKKIDFAPLMLESSSPFLKFDKEKHKAIFNNEEDLNTFQKIFESFKRINQLMIEISDLESEIAAASLRPTLVEDEVKEVPAPKTVNLNPAKTDTIETQKRITEEKPSVTPTEIKSEVKTEINIEKESTPLKTSEKRPESATNVKKPNFVVRFFVWAWEGTKSFFSWIWDNITDLFASKEKPSESNVTQANIKEIDKK